MKRWIAIGLLVVVVGGIIVYNKILKPAPGAGGPGGQAGGGGKGAAGRGGLGGPGAGQTAAVSGFIVAPTSIQEQVVASGSLLASEQVDIYPEVAGRIVTLNIQEGRSVQKGALLIKLYDADLRAQLQKLYVQEENARRTEERNRQLLQRGGISQQEYDIVTTNLKSALADIELVKAQIRRTEIRAPFTGVIGLRNVSPGAYVSPSTLIARLQQVSSLKLDFSIPEKYGASVKVGSVVDFTVDGVRQNFKGNVYAIDPGVEEETRNLRIRARATNPGATLRPGMFAKVNLIINTDRALVVPTQAVIPQTRGKQVAIINKGKAVFRDVTTGIRSASTVEITSGLEQGDTVITTGLNFLRPDSPVKIAKVEGLPGKKPAAGASGANVSMR
ncbi:efflux RND transporter periplasmic adaptor subunit [Tellurirhabdus rosea]|uniref:efflux RND transporter periplasmic adaptor subunit n=1 Tax=Tellurirhabdus rosea TaxID=2674997 RepID=UPI00225242E9|nr:efflux RND transporter periplasmic adaptor subunit [Tellurirhabdus rosea]